MPRRLHALGRLSCSLVAAATTTAALAWILLRTDYAPLRYGAAGVVLAGACASLLLGRVADNWPARLLRALGFAPLLGEGLLLVRSFGGAGADGLAERTSHGLPVYGGTLLIGAIALAAATSRRVAVPPRALTVAGGIAAVAGTAVLVPELFAPPLPAAPGFAVLAVLGAGVAALLLTLRWLDDPRPAAIAALCASLLTAVLLAAATEGLLLFTSRWVPDTSPVNVPAADRPLNNRLGAEDPYLWLLGLALLAALTLAGTTVRGHRSAPVQGSTTGLPAPM